ncbi:BQ2448_5040 [Microbotryum intermedium]|uniref:BQ2448_5040 protein n=1 Tax=Microbotryum intermedium TaxID=269621 RepID=A0A238F3Z9_9BASI|nr:BQ2448_5040 [Microbotryum intermedium]
MSLRHIDAELTGPLGFRRSLTAARVHWLRRRNRRHFTSTRHRIPRPPPLPPSDSLAPADSAFPQKHHDALVPDQGRWSAEDGFATFILSPVTFDFYSPGTSPTSPITSRRHSSSGPSSPILALTTTSRAQGHDVREGEPLATSSSVCLNEDYNGLFLTEASLQALHVLGYTSLSTPSSFSSSSSQCSPKPSQAASPDRFQASTSLPRRGHSSLTQSPEVGMDPIDVFFGISSPAEAKAFRSGLIGLGIELGVKGGWEGVEDLDPLLASSVQEMQAVQKQGRLEPTWAPKKPKAGPKRAIRKAKSVKERLKHLLVASSYEHCD